MGDEVVRSSRLQESGLSLVVSGVGLWNVGNVLVRDCKMQVNGV